MGKKRIGLLIGVGVLALAFFAILAMRPKNDLAPFRPYVQKEYVQYSAYGKRYKLRIRQINLQNITFPQAAVLLDQIYSKKCNWHKVHGTWTQDGHPTCCAYIFGRMDADNWQGVPVTNKPPADKPIPSWNQAHYGPPYVYFEEIGFAGSWQERILAKLTGKQID